MQWAYLRKTYNTDTLLAITPCIGNGAQWIPTSRQFPLINSTLNDGDVQWNPYTMYVNITIQPSYLLPTKCRSITPAVHVDAIERPAEVTTSPIAFDRLACMRTLKRDFSVGETVSRPWWPVIRQTVPLRSATRIPSSRSPLRVVLFNERLLSSSRFYKYVAVDETRVAIVEETSVQEVPKEKPRRTGRTWNYARTWR